jgi:hypothetical protein
MGSRNRCNLPSLARLTITWRKACNSLPTAHVCRLCYISLVPEPTYAATRARAECENAKLLADARKREDKRKYRDATKDATESPTMIGDRTHNGTSRNHKLRDSAQRHEAQTAYVLSDTSIYRDATLVGVERKRGGIALIRDDAGNVDASATLALVQATRRHNAARKTEGK